MQHLLLRYTQALLTQMAQTAVCIGIIRWTSNCVDGCYSVSTACRRMN